MYFSSLTTVGSRICTWPKPPSQNLIWNSWEYCWSCKKLRWKPRAASISPPTTEEKYDPEKRGWNWAPTTLLEALNPAVIMDLLGSFQLYTPLALAYVPPEDKDSSAGGLDGRWSQGHWEEWQEGKWPSKGHVCSQASCHCGHPEFHPTRESLRTRVRLLPQLIPPERQKELRF